jgi:hypothetical protein
MFLKKILIVSLSALIGCVAHADSRVDAAAKQADAQPQSGQTVEKTATAKAISTNVHPNGTQFYITSIHPESAWYGDPIFNGKLLTATTCTDDTTTYGINYLTSASSRAGWYDACFYMQGNSSQYYVYGFNFSLSTGSVGTTPPPITTTSNTATYVNGVLSIPRLEVSGPFGNVYYKIELEYVPGSSGSMMFRLKNASNTQ